MNLIHEAIIFATRKHNGYKRKGTDIPYISHPMEVMQILTETRCRENVIIAGILHDTLEDTEATSAEILDLFGEEVLNLVSAESEDKSKTWKERKQATIDSLADASLDVKMVCLADKISNLRSMASDKKAIGEKLWERFNAGKDDIEWYYRQIGKMAFHPLDKEYHSLLTEVFGD
jgi:(p)ppGpp synthase/HD superfamily hydrolase